MLVCPDCTTAFEGRYQFEHVCAVTDLPPALNTLGDYSVRETVNLGRGLWSHFTDDDGTERAFHVGAMAGTSDAAMVIGIDAHLEEMAALVAEAREEFAR